MQQLLFLQGYAGSGKTTLARALSEILGWEHLNRDGLGTGDITDDAQERAVAYQRLRLYLPGLIAQGQSVIIDAPYLHELTAGTFVDEARSYQLPYNAVWITAQGQERIRRRKLRRAPWDLIDLEQAVIDEQRDYRPPPGWPQLHSDQISTAQAIEYLLAVVKKTGV